MSPGQPPRPTHPGSTGWTSTFIHVKSRHENTLPLIITHGWPGSIIELFLGGRCGPNTVRGRL
jgi:hypothetical protein